MAATYQPSQWLIPKNANTDKVGNYSLQFDGTADIITISNFNSLANSNNFTFSFWAYFDTVGYYTTVLNHYSTIGCIVRY